MDGKPSGYNIFKDSLKRMREQSGIYIKIAQ
jgi:hypothetical protein